MKIMLYAHDGRGAGHAARTAAIAHGINRLYPETKVLCVTGHSLFDLYMENANIDWIKLPSYKTVIENGNVRNKAGPLGYGASLCKFRAQLLETIVKHFRPNIVIVDYFPKGKHNELEHVLRISKEEYQSRIYLGLRGVISSIDNCACRHVFNNNTISFINQYYDGIFCYVDKKVFNIALEYQLPEQIQQKIFYTGYISRAYEIGNLGKIPKIDKIYNKVIGFGCSVNAFKMMSLLLKLKERRFEKERWAFFIGQAFGENDFQQIVRLSKQKKRIEVKEFSKKYLGYMAASDAIISHGGYNSITDSLWLKKPTLYIARDVPERDQELHLAKLKMCGVVQSVLNEANFTEKELLVKIQTLKNKNTKVESVSLKGTELIAKYILEN